MLEIRGVVWLAAVIIWIVSLSTGTNTQVVAPGRRTENTAPTIVEQPKSLLVKRGDPATLNCKAEGRPTPDITWYKDGQLLQIDSGGRRALTLLDNGATLFFYQVVGNRQGGQDGGVYQCLAQNELGTARSNNATLEIAYLKSEFKLEPESAEVISGESEVLECNPPRGYPNPEVTWLKDNVVIVPDGNRVKILEDGNLMLKELRKDDEGTYKCKAENVAGEETSREAVLTVQVKPSFINPPQDTITAPGEAAVLRCEVEGDPTPTVTWTKEGAGELSDTRFQQLEDASLRIQATREEDDGMYICTAQNIWGTSDARARLRVSAVPNFRQAPRDKTIQAGQDVRFQCAADGSPPPSIHWQMPGDKEMLFTNQQKGRFTVSREGELHIRAVQQGDGGQYVCYATGGTGMSEASALLRVLEELRRPPPIIQYGPVNQTLVVGSTATFDCQAAGSPAPSIEWTKDGSPLATGNARFTRQSGGTLEISGVQSEDSGLYSCIASSNDGETILSASLLVIDAETLSNPVKTAPSVHELANAPSQPVKVNATRSTIFIRWNTPTSNGRAPPVSTYQVEYFSPDQATGSGWVIVATNVRGESYQINHLSPAASYMFLVRAVNVKGVGPPSPLSEIITTDDDCLSEVLRSTRVEIKSITALSPTAIKVTWEAAENEDEVDTYQVRYRLSSGDSNAHSQTVRGKTWTIITGLVPGMDYTVSLMPQVCGKMGQESPNEAARTMDEGAGPLCLEADDDNRLLQSKLDSSQISISSIRPLNANALEVNWQMVKSAVLYTEGYHVKYYKTDRSPSQYTIKTVMDQSSLTTFLSGLSPWQQYTIAVRPFSGFYCGQESAPVTERTSPDRPRGPPQSVYAKSNGTTAILVGWRPLRQDQMLGYIEGYHIWCRGNASAQDRNRTIKGNASLTGRVTGLEAGKVYRVSVAAYNPSGVGPSSPVFSVSLPLTEGPPSEQKTDGLPPTEADETEGGVASKPWFYGVIAGIVLVVAFVLIVFVLRRRKLKHAANMTKNPLGLEGATHMTTLTSQYDGQPTGNGHPSWPPDQTWRSNNSSECQSSSLHESKEHMHSHPEKVDLGTSKSDQYNRNNVPVYAVVDNESDDEDTSPSCPHMSHTLPIGQCTHMMQDHCQSLPPQMTEPYASTTLVLPPNIREYMAQKQNVSDTSSGSASGSITYPLPSSAAQQKGRKKPGKKGRPGEDGGPPLPPHREGSHMCLDCQTGLSDSGSRRKPKTRTGAGTKYPTCNWTEFLPPPPEEPPMMGQDSMTKIKPPPPCKGHPGGHFMGHPNGHSNFLPIQPAMSIPHQHQQQQQAPALPMRNHTQYPPYPYPQPPQQANGLPRTLPVVSRGDEIPHHPSVPSTLPVQRPGMLNGQAYPMGGMGNMGVQPLAPHQVFEDPRHEQLGRELLEFNDDLMSQSEAMSDNEEGQPMLPSLGTNTVISDQSSKLIPEDLEADLETSSNCTGSMLASWASMNGSSSGGSNRNSGSSCSSDGSFCAETDFAAAVTAAAQNAGIPVVGSPPADSTKVGRDLDASEQMGNGSAKDSRRSTPVTRKGPAVPTSLFPELQQHRVAPSDHHPYHHQQQQQPPATSQRILPPPPSSHVDMQQDSLNKNKRRAPPHDNLFLRDTNDLGLTVTANPMAFAHEEEEGFHS